MNATTSNLRIGISSLAAAVLLTATPLSAATLTWENPVSGDFNTDSNWSPNQMPVAGDTVDFNKGTPGSSTVTFTANGDSGMARFLDGALIIQTCAHTWNLDNEFRVGDTNNSSAAPSVTLNGGTVVTNNYIRIGNNGNDQNGSLNLTNGASLSSTFASVPLILRNGTNNSLNLDGASSLSLVGGIQLGVISGSSQNSIMIQGGSSLTANGAVPSATTNRILIGAANGTDQQSITITGTGSNLTTNTEILAVGNAGTSTNNSLTVSNGGMLNAVGANVTLTGNNNNNAFTVSGGTANVKKVTVQLFNDVIVTANGVLNIGSGGFVFGTNGQLDFSSGEISSQATTNANLAMVIGDGVGDSATYRLNGGTHNMGAGGMSLSSDGILAGTGSVTAGTVTTLAGGSTIAPGNSIGTITIDSTLNTSAGATFDFEWDAGLTSDLLDLGTWITTGAANGSQVFNFTDLGGATNGIYTLATFTTGTGLDINQFAVGSLPVGLSGNFILNSNSLQFNAIPEPTSAVLVGLAALALLATRRRLGC